MTGRSMFILSAGSYSAEVSGEPPPLKALAREATGGSARRTDRFVQLALIGAGRCVNGRSLPPATATYFTSGRGDLEVTVDLLVQLCAKGVPPAPFDFINTVGNSACFHVARSFGLQGRSVFVTSRHAPLESGLRLAAVDMAHDDVRTALVGSADMCTWPLSAHRARIGVGPGSPVGEGSHWFLLAAEPGPDAYLGEVRAIRSFPDDAALVRHVRRLEIDPGRAALAAGSYLGLDRLESFRRAIGIERAFDYQPRRPWYDTRTGHGLHAFLMAPPARTLVHVDGDPSGRSSLIVLDATRRGGPDSKQPLHDPRTDR
jgi:hypothetical protein